MGLIHKLNAYIKLGDFVNVIEEHINIFPYRISAR